VHQAAAGMVRVAVVSDRGEPVSQNAAMSISGTQVRAGAAVLGRIVGVAGIDSACPVCPFLPLTTLPPTIERQP
jgi:hypothetical protein